MTPGDPFTRASWYGWAILAVAAIGVVFACTVSQAQAQQGSSRLIFDCKELSAIVGEYAEFRDAGASVDRVIGNLRPRLRNINQARFEVLARELRRMWTEALPADEAAFQLFQRCQRQLGDMGQSDI